jgi:hypothetical protein
MVIDDGAMVEGGYASVPGGLEIPAMPARQATLRTPVSTRNRGGSLRRRV